MSEFEDAGINQTRHKIILKVSTNVMTIAPFYSSLQNFENDITIAETVIVGNIPETYYNLSGMEDITDETKIELMQ